MIKQVIIDLVFQLYIKLNLVYDQVLLLIINVISNQRKNISFCFTSKSFRLSNHNTKILKSNHYKRAIIKHQILQSFLQIGTTLSTFIRIGQTDIYNAQINAEIKALSNKKKITQNSYAIIANQLQQRIQETLLRFQGEVLDFAQIGTAFTELKIFQEIVFNSDCECIIYNCKIVVNSDQPLNLRGKQEMLMHEMLWNLVSQDGQYEQVETQMVLCVFRILMDPVKLTVEETAQLVLDFLNYEIANYAQKFEQAKRLVIQFRALTQNQMFSSYPDKKKEEIEDIKEKYSPSINQKSQILAYQNRQKYIDKQLSTQSQSCVDVLLKKKEEFNREIKKQQQQKQEEKMKECTFQPKINQNYSQNSTIDVVSRLYTQESIYQKRLYQEENIRKTQEQRELTELNQCTFTPLINDGIPISTITSSTPKDYDKMVDRMRSANNKAKEQKDKLNHISTGEQLDKLRNSPFNPPQMVNRPKLKKKPIVIMDVNICPGKQGRLALYEDQDPQDVVKNFSKLFNLNTEMSDILLNVLEKERQKMIKKQNT
ncbi:unnamed protein product [Paramecium sonneborni]|uniref:Uncharacterized protein n=1 Tax=Paramecium sonneborni TaxID=65129 RepID=A0A8S1QKN7_9CILI|nr:unnamed protein product [Paramecium sonneborni]